LRADARSVILVLYKTNVEGSDSLDRDNLGYLLAKASQRWNELLYERFVRAGYDDVRPSYGSVLVPLFEEDGLRMGELARRSRVAKQTMTTLVRLTERDGLVCRERDPDDGRAFRIYLTERSRAFRPVAEAAVTELDSLVRDRLSPAEGAALKRMLQGVMEL
jgi:DNA-binding MarR family transcriptional regulator